MKRNGTNERQFQLLCHVYSPRENFLRKTEVLQRVTFLGTSGNDFLGQYIMVSAWDTSRCTYTQYVKPWSRLAHSCQSLFPFLQHEAASSISIPPGCYASSSQATLLQFFQVSLTTCQYPFMFLGGERLCESNMSYLRTQHSVPSQDLNPDCSIQGRAH